MHGVPVTPGKLPLVSLVQFACTDVPAKATCIAASAMKPVPVTSMVLPGVPEEGWVPMLGMTENVVLATLDPSVAETSSRPAGTAGMMKVQGVPVVPGKLPFKLETQFDGTDSPETENWIVLPAEKFVPLALTNVPTGPELGAAENVARVTLNVAFATSVPSDAVIRYDPSGTTGTVIVQDVPPVMTKLPFASVAQVEAMEVPLNANAIVALGAKPRPVASTDVPTRP